jgi:hypothetical protein
MSLDILPLAFTMVVGPGLMAAVILVTAPRPIPVSTAYVAGFAIATLVGVAAARGIASLLGDGFSLGRSDDKGSAGTIIQLALVALLILASLKAYLSRETAEPPKWLGTVMEADPKRALKMGLVIVMVMPTDLVIMLTVGLNLEQNGSPLVDALPFVGLTALVAATPFLFYLLFRRPARRYMPKVRDWMNANSWAVNVLVYGIFIVLILA